MAFVIIQDIAGAYNYSDLIESRSCVYIWYPLNQDDHIHYGNVTISLIVNGKKSHATSDLLREDMPRSGKGCVIYIQRP